MGVGMHVGMAVKIVASRQSRVACGRVDRHGDGKDPV
jgi:hypothetical protein